MKIKQFLKTTFLLYFWFALTGCGQKKASDIAEPNIPTPTSPSDPKGNAPTARLNPSKFTSLVVGLNEPNKYVVKLSVSSNTSNYLIGRKAREESVKIIGSLAKNETTFEDSDVLAGMDYEYSIFLNETDKTEKKDTVYVTIPKDLVVQGTVNEVRTAGFDRVFLMEGSRIQTLGRDFSFETLELISKGGVIETYPEGTKATNGSSGRTPGRIVIKAKSAKGLLTILNRGENGGDGQNGEKGNSGSKGERGVDGSSRTEENPLLPHCHLPFSSNLPDCQLTRRNVCTQGPGNGAQGGVGGAGTSGTAGANGGSTASVQILVGKTDEFSPILKNLPGAGGNGGAGGEGGDGGAGGDAGTRDSLGACGTAGQGPQGAKGPNGTNGMKGLDGSTSQSCLRIEGNENQCQQFSQ